MLTIFRIQHRVSGKGPFQHGRQRVINVGVSGKRLHFEDIDHLPQVKKLLAKHKGNIRFGFTSLDLVESAILDWKQLNRYRFDIIVKKVEPLYISESGQTVLYLEKQRG